MRTGGYFPGGEETVCETEGIPPPSPFTRETKGSRHGAVLN